MSKPHVICFQQRLTHYRESFFQLSKDQLALKGIDFDLVYGQPDAAAQIRKDSGHLSWAYAVHETTLHVGRFTGVWVPMPSTMARPDLVIMTQENKLLANYAWIIRRMFGGPKVAYWGHGANFQSTVPDGLRERWKRLWLNKVDWWFAYTQMTVDVLKKAGYPAAQTTCLNNAIDNEGFKRDLDAVEDAEVCELRNQLHIPLKAPVGLFCGSLYPDKRIDFMVQAADKIRENVPDFAMVLVGDGPSVNEIRQAAQSRPWLHWVGVKRGKDKAAFFKLAQVVVNPGAVGLHVLDSFVSGLPIATTANARHGPEVAYLEHGVNGINIDGDCTAYAEAVANLLLDDLYYAKVRKASIECSQKYKLTNMVKNFTDGIEQCLIGASIKSK